MTREEYINFANALKNNYTIDFDKLPEFCNMAISALSEHKPRTNGGAIISLYPDLKYTIQNGRVVTTIGVASSFDLEWWNAPYQKGGET